MNKENEQHDRTVKGNYILKGGEKNESKVQKSSVRLNTISITLYIYTGYYK